MDGSKETRSVCNSALRVPPSGAERELIEQMLMRSNEASPLGACRVTSHRDKIVLPTWSQQIKGLVIVDPYRVVGRNWVGVRAVPWVMAIRSAPLQGEIQVRRGPAEMWDILSRVKGE